MKRILSIMLLLGLLLTLFGCDETNNQPEETSQPTETTLSTAGTTQPNTESTERTETTTAPVDEWQPSAEKLAEAEVMAEYHFEPWDETYFIYRYCGEDSEIHLPPYGGITLHLPEEWVDRVIVSGQDPFSGAIGNEPWSHWEIYVTNKEIMNASYEMFDDPNYHMGYLDYMLCISAVNKTEERDHPCVYLGEDENYRYYFVVPESWEDGTQVLLYA